MNKVRIGIIGIGGIGSYHAKYLDKGEVPGALLTAVCDINPARLEWARENLDQSVKLFDNVESFLSSGCVDGVLICNVHYDHPPTAVKAFEKGLHVLIEKPAGVYTKQVRIMNEAAVKSGKVFGIMFCQRTNPVYRKLRDLIQSNELGGIKRINWIITNWYRSQSYYDSGGWRATWKGEGGGVLLNQCPHQLDLWQWIFGMPKRVKGFCSFGKYHDIEVEDDVTAYMEYENGATGVFIASTGEAPGSNRLEVAGDMGKIIVEDDRLTFWRLRISERRFNKEFKGGFGEPECWKCEVPVVGENLQHVGITRNWVDAIFSGKPLIAPGLDGINSLEISNSIYLSSWTDAWIEIPVNEDLFYEKLQERIMSSKDKKNERVGNLDVKNSFKKT